MRECRGFLLLSLLVAACASPRAPRFDLIAEEPAAAKQKKVAPAPGDGLAREVEEVSEIIVTGRRLPDGVPVVPLSSIGSRNVFGPEEVRETGARDINDLVQYLPALSTRPYNGGESSAPSFSMRGLPDDGLTEYVNILIDGVPASPLPYGWTAFSFLPITPDRIFAIDYIRGAHSVRYSPNTVGGILNFITQPIPVEPTLGFRTTVGNFNYLSTMVFAGGQVKDVGLFGAFVDRSGDGYRENGDFSQRDANVKARWDINNQSWLAASMSYMEDDHKAPGGLTQTEFDLNRFGNTRPRNEFNGYRFVTDAVYHSEFDGGGWWEGFLYFSDTKRRLRAQRPHFGTPTDFLDWTDNSYFWGVGTRIEQIVTIGSVEHRIYGGARYQGETIPSWKIYTEPFAGGPRTLTRDSDYRLQTLSFHIDDTFEPVKNLTIQAGVRVEWVPVAKGDDDVIPFTYDDDYFKILPGVGASYVIAGKVALFANYFEGFRAPQAWGFGNTAPGSSLKFEEGRIIEAGVRGQDENSGVSGAVTVWRTDYDDFGVFFSGFYENLGKIVAEGLDFEAEWDLGRVWEALQGFSVVGSFTLQNSKLRSGPDSGNQVPYAWKDKAAWRLRYTRAGWRVSLGGVYVGDSFSDSANTSTPSADGTIGVNPSRVLWDAQIAKRVPIGRKGDLGISLGATNLFDKSWYVHSRGGFFGGGLVAGPPLQGYVSLDFVLNW